MSNQHNSQWNSAAYQAGLDLQNLANQQNLVTINHPALAAGTKFTIAGINATFTSAPIVYPENKTPLSKEDFEYWVDRFNLDMEYTADSLRFCFEAIPFKDIPKYSYLKNGDIGELLRWRLQKGI